VRIWVDSDIGGNPDDAIALLCALAHPGVELVGVSTVDADVEKRADEARRLLRHVPVVAGSPPPSEVLGADALLLIGPWTHGAELARAGDLPKRVAAMGGALRPVFHRGELQVIEHNVSRDPAAAQALLAQPEPLLVVPLDVSATLVCTREEELAIVRAQPRLADMIARWRAFEGDVPLCLHDPLALLALLGEPGIEIQDYPVSVAPNGVMRSRGTEHNIVVAADRDQVVARVLALLAEHLG
jgi:inosine-uridine nucleoside N-ribohydrolase